MKKFLLVLAIGAFVACNDSATTDNAASDTSGVESLDTTTVVTPDTTTATVDTTSTAVDTTKR